MLLVAEDARPLLEVVNLHVARSSRPPQEVLRVDYLAVSAGETLGVLGETGAGKTVLGLAVLRLLPPELQVTQGTNNLHGEDLFQKSETQMRRIRGKGVAMVVGGGHSALNPMETIGTQLVNVIRSHSDVDKHTAHRMSVEALDMVGLPDAERRANSYPHELSGGMAQRVVVAQAMISQPKVLIADEPTSDLDVTVAAQILDKMKELISQQDAATLILTRDLGIVAQYCDRVAVLDQGALVEYASVSSFFTRAYHPTSLALLAAAKQARTYGRDGLDTPQSMPECESNQNAAHGHQGNSTHADDSIFHPSEFIRISREHVIRRS